MGFFTNPDSRAARLLVGWYGVYQAGHIVVNGTYLLRRGVPPFAPPPQGWLPQTVAFLDGMAIADLVNAILSVLVVIGFLRQAKWRFWLGTVTLTVSIYAATVFTYGSLTAGAWNGQISEYLWVYLPFIPVVLLFVVWLYWLMAGRFTAMHTP